MTIKIKMGNSSNKILNLNNKQEIDAQIKKYNNRSRGEKVCRLILESLFNVSFSSGYPEFLAYSSNSKKDSKKTKLEIDLYNEKLGLGLEYQGKQHYIFVKHFHTNMEGFKNSLKRDDFKRRLCHQNGVYLIEVPYFVKENQLGDYIWNRLPNHLQKLIEDEYISKLLKNQLVIK